ncbi:M42 family metallopeptidase [candidate division TA06 bacterium]|nr:M42 family metallopeptidase [candidate division TA06 bacterium]
MERIVQLLKDLEAIHSPSGYTGAVMDHITELCQKNGITTRRTNKGGLLCGNHQAPKLVVSGHVDTLGLMVSGINSDGSLAFTKIGSPVLASFEGEYVTIITSEDKKFRGTLLLNNPAAHVNKEADKAERKPDSMHIRLDAEVAKKEETEKLGIRTGDFICFDPRFEYTDSGFIKCRFLDDKAGSAAMMDALLALGSKELEKLPVAFFFSNYEEVGHGASAGVPATAAEMLVVDMGVVGEKVDGVETAVSICVKDSNGPYDYAMRQKISRLATAHGIAHRLDVFPLYGSDGGAALAAGCDIRVGLIGPGVSASHGMERTHLKGLNAARDLLMAYIKETLS